MNLDLTRPCTPCSTRRRAAGGSAGALSGSAELLILGRQAVWAPCDVVERHQIATRPLGERVAVHQRPEAWTVVRHFQVGEFVGDEIVQGPAGQSGRPRGDPDHAGRRAAGAPAPRLLCVRDAVPAEVTAEIAAVEGLGPALKVAVGGPSLADLPLEPGAHPLRPLLAFGD